jgi:hypothetical protein
MRLAIVLAEFGKPLPDISQFKKYFPEADIRVYTDGDVPDLFPPGRRHGYHMNDYWKVKKLLESGEDIAIAFDADMRIVSDDVKVLPLLAENFGLCLPANPRQLVRVDTEIGADSDRQLDETRGAGYAYNTSPIALNLNHVRARICADEYCNQMILRTVRAPLAFWRAAWNTGFSPYLLPPQWCVCEKDIGCGNEIILHEGHEKVKQHYRSLQ